MVLRKGDIVGVEQVLGIIQWIDSERAGVETKCLEPGYRPMLSSANVFIEELEFIHRPMDFEDKQLMFPFYYQLQYEDEGRQRVLMKEYQDNKKSKLGVSGYEKGGKKHTLEQKIAEKLKGMSPEEIVKLLGG